MERESSGSFLAPKKNTPSASAIQMSCGPSIAFLLRDWLEHPPSRHPASGEALEASAATSQRAEESPEATSPCTLYPAEAWGTSDRNARAPSERRAGSTARGGLVPGAVALICDRFGRE